jgi:hypothetical protein
MAAATVVGGAADHRSGGRGNSPHRPAQHATASGAKLAIAVSRVSKHSNTFTSVVITKQVRQPAVHAQQLDRAAAALRGAGALDQLAEAAAVHVPAVDDIQDDPGKSLQ